MAQKLPIPILAGNSYEISSLSLAISKGYGFRFNNLPHLNSFLIEPKAKTLLQRLIHQKNYSIRAIERSYRIARTIADFDECE